MRVAAVMILAATAVSAQAPASRGSGDPLFEQLIERQRVSDIYRGVLAVYIAGGEMKQVVMPLQSWTRTEFDAAIDAIIARRDTREMEAAAVLQLEIGLAVVGASVVSAEQHLNLGKRLVDVIRSRHLSPNLPKSMPLPRDFVDFYSNWCAVAGSVLLWINDARGKPWIGMALAMAPRSAVLNTYWGAATELEAAELYRGSWASESYWDHVSLDLRRRLLAAADSYRKAIEYDAEYAAAYLRLGRLQLFLGNLADAQARFERARAVAIEPAQQYLSHLMLGRVLLEKGDHDGARASYERALAIVPGAQSATVAIGYLDVITGRPDLAQQRARRFMAAPVDDEPWWEYKSGGLYHAGLEWLRQRVRQ